MRIAIVVGSTRPGRKGREVGEWVLDIAAKRDDAEYELVDLADFDLDLLNEATVPGAAKRQYENPKTRRWSEVIDGFDGYIWITPEYNHGVPAALKNAFDVLYPEWANKSAGLVSYGADCGVRAVEHWRTIMINAHLYAVRPQVSMSTMTEWKDETVFQPLERREAEVGRLLRAVVNLAGALAPLRAPKA